MRVLVVEDNPDTGFMIKSLLMKKYQAEVDIAGDCSEARRRLGSYAYDIITLDYQLPDCDGLEMLDEITGVEGHPPVVMITGHGDEELAYLSFRMGASGYAAKDRNLSAMLSEAVEWALADAAEKRAILTRRELMETRRRSIVEAMETLGREVDRADKSERRLRAGESSALDDLRSALDAIRKQADDIEALLEGGR